MTKPITRKIVIILISVFLPVSVLARSEITGYISTDPARPAERIDAGAQDNNGMDDTSRAEDRGPVSGGGGAGILFAEREKSAGQNPERENAAAGSRPVVLGYDRLPGNTLVRDENGRIYVIMDAIKKVIWNLNELRQYRGEPILDLPDSELAEYPTRRFYDHALVRRIGDEKVYAVAMGVKKHVKSLAELSRDYFLEEIHNIMAEEFSLY